MHNQLREAVHRSLLADGLELTDSATGFAVELGPNSVALLDGSGPLSAEFWGKLRQMGLTTEVSDLKEVRRLQRVSFRGATPPVLERLRDRLARIRREVPFFRQHAATYDPALLSDFTDFAQLPFMRKRDLREGFPSELIPEHVDLAAGIAAGHLTVLATSGSTDERLQIIARSPIERLPFGSDDLLGIEIGGCQPRTAFLTPPTCSAFECRLGAASFEERRSKTSPDLFLNTTDDPFAISRELLDGFCEDMERFQPAILAADPIYLQCMARGLQRHRMEAPGVKLIQRGFEFGTRASVRDLRHTFGVPVLNDYGASEENRLAIECHRGSLHVRADAMHLEIVNRHGLCAPGVVGAVAVTTFDTMTPLVRYLNGDAAAWNATACDCDFKDWPTIELHGRLKDMIRSRARWVTTLEIDDAVRAPDWLDFYRVLQLDKNAFEVLVIPALDRNADFGDLAGRLDKCLGPNEIQYRNVSRLDPLQSMKIGTTQTRLPTPEIP